MKKQEGEFAIRNAHSVLPDRTLPSSSVLVRDGKITEIDPANRKFPCDEVDAQGCYLLPGFIDMHNDAIEKEIEPRPNTFLPLEAAIFELDKRLASCGVTTIYHSICFDESDEGLRSKEKSNEIIREMRRLSSVLSVRTKIHARYEVTNVESIGIIEALLDEGMIDLLSIMDHTPGQGQYKAAEPLIDYYRKAHHLSEESIATLLERKKNRRDLYAEKNALHFADLARAKNIPLASHDDDSALKISKVKRLGAIISEFPINIEAAEAASQEGLSIVLGAPNVMRGYSHNGNLSARSVLERGYGDIVCSDYLPMSLVHALFAIVDDKLRSLNEAACLFSKTPSEALGLSDTLGSIECGKLADLILVGRKNGIPRIFRTWVSGIDSFGREIRTEYRHEIRFIPKNHMSR